ncbi:hypothetical protein B0H65DRAFT_438628 [Neurospora tetraspora]|uniref:Uncharacterized protein n=1 Tax=Neurospora tetraspora TaxID=94610 RepID=A0AAE0MWD3_9PEZI|nr:hypothetical protein B0H65DRAFT_438628 [Neurospora tetraspora]
MDCGQAVGNEHYLSGNLRQTCCGTSWANWDITSQSNQHGPTRWNKPLGDWRPDSLEHTEQKRPSYLLSFRARYAKNLRQILAARGEPIKARTLGAAERPSKPSMSASHCLRSPNLRWNTFKWAEHSSHPHLSQPGKVDKYPSLAHVRSAALEVPGRFQDSARNFNSSPGLAETIFQLQGGVGENPVQQALPTSSQIAAFEISSA